MKKSDLIQRVVNCTVPAGASLVRQDLPGGLQVAEITPQNASGLRVMMAEMNIQALESQLVEHGDEVTPALLRSLHEACVTNTDANVAATFFEAVQQEAIEDHRKMVAEIGKASRELGVAYSQPEDPFLV